LTEDDVRQIRELLSSGISQVDIAAQFEVTVQSIYSIAHGQSWNWFEKENQDGSGTGYAIGSRNKSTVLTEDDVRVIKRMLAAGELQKVVAEMFGVGNNTISAIATGKTWGWL
jgi:transposase